MSTTNEQLQQDIETNRQKNVELEKKVLSENEHVQQLQRRHEAVTTGTAVVGGNQNSQVGPNDDSRLTNKEKLEKYKEQRGELTTKIKQLQQQV